MNYFTDVSALHKVLSVVFENGPGEPGQTLFAESLESELGFTKEQASLYPSIVLSQNSNGSADWVAMNAADMGELTHRMCLIDKDRFSRE
jgi:hypothetical protein